MIKKMPLSLRTFSKSIQIICFFDRRKHISLALAQKSFSLAANFLNIWELTFIFYMLTILAWEHTCSDDVPTWKAEHWIHNGPKDSDSRASVYWRHQYVPVASWWDWGCIHWLGVGNALQFQLFSNLAAKSPLLKMSIDVLEMVCSLSQMNDSVDLHVSIS